MTGLDPETDTIMSFCCFITNSDLDIMEPHGCEAIIHHDQSTLDKMSEWCIKTHGESGLTVACTESTTTADEAADTLLTYIRTCVPQTGRALLAGNSVHCDKAFLSKSPWNKVLEHLHYRILDVSSIKEAARRWAPQRVLHRIPPKKGAHTAKEDILESIAEARFYREIFFLCGTYETRV